MYTPPQFRIEDPGDIRVFIKKHPFGLLLSIDGNQIHDTHTPFIQTEDGKLLGHIARTNPQWKSWSSQNRVKVIFTGPHAYVSPHYYVSEFAVPTWNYAAVSISGKITILEEEQAVLGFLDRLVTENEKPDNPWAMDRNDERYMDLLSGIVVFSVSVDLVEASFKLNQNKTEEDQVKVIKSLSSNGCPHDQGVAAMMSRNLGRSGQGSPGNNRP